MVGISRYKIYIYIYMWHSMAFYGILWLMRCVIIHLKLRRHRFRTWFNSSNFCRRCRSAPGSGRRLPSGPFNMPMVPPVYLSPKKRAQVWHPNDIQMTSKWHPNDIQMTSKWHPMTINASDINDVVTLRIFMAEVVETGELQMLGQRSLNLCHSG